jgi:hypothetical protein
MPMGYCFEAIRIAHRIFSCIVATFTGHATSPSTYNSAPNFLIAQMWSITKAATKITRSLIDNQVDHTSILVGL